MRGAFILIEGLDRAGKSTQCERLKQHLTDQGRPTELLKFPNRETAIGKMINEYLTSTKESSSKLSDEAIHLLFSANRWEQAPVIEELLNQGKSIVVDRYLFSGIAFSAAKDGPQMNTEWCKNPDIGLPAPDLTIFLDVSETVAESRGGYGQERYEKLEFQRRVRDRFYELRKLEQAQDRDWTVISADGSLDDVEQKIWEAVEAKALDNDLGPVMYIK